MDAAVATCHTVQRDEKNYLVGASVELEMVRHASSKSLLLAKSHSSSASPSPASSYSSSVYDPATKRNPNQASGLSYSASSAPSPASSVGGSECPRSGNANGNELDSSYCSGVTATTGGARTVRQFEFCQRRQLQSVVTDVVVGVGVRRFLFTKGAPAAV